jgi:ankyrin repeat protein
MFPGEHCGSPVIPFRAATAFGANLNCSAVIDEIWDMVKGGDSERLLAIIAEQRKSSEATRSDDLLLNVAWQVNRRLIPWLLENGVNPDQRDSVGGTVLMYAAADDAIETVEALIRHGADVNAKNDSGETAFSYACTNDSFRAAKLLHAAGADVNTVDAGGGSPLDWASNWAGDEFYAWLVGIGCRHVDGAPRGRA